jgi:S-DNA-T family DNA segregation ATPase FtsK/SpoIIIE
LRRESRRARWIRRPFRRARPPPPVRRLARAWSRPPLPLGESDAPSRAPIERKLGGFTLPPLALLDAPRTERKIDERELMERAHLLEEKSREFSVEGSVVQIHPGPVVTTYEFKPDAGVKYSKITGLA